MNLCKSIGCYTAIPHGTDYCEACSVSALESPETPQVRLRSPERETRSTQGKTEVDVYAVLHMFELVDPSGCLHGATSKLLLSGNHTDEHRYATVTAARDLLDRWIQLNEDSAPFQ